MTEEKVSEKCFDLIFAFDEVKCLVQSSIIRVDCFRQVITAGGYKEPINLQQIRTNMEMESHEEKLHDMIKRSKMETAKDQALIAQRAIRDKQKEAALRPQFGGNTGFGSDGSSSFNEPTTFNPTPVIAQQQSSAPATASLSRNSNQHVVKGMQLGQGGKTKSVEDALIKEDNLSAPVLKTLSKASTSGSGDVGYSAVANVIQHPIMMVISEKVSANMSRDGLLELFEIKGSLTLTAATDEAALCSVQLTQSNTNLFQFNTHPKVNKGLYEKSGLLQLKDSTKGFPSVRPVGILKWNYSGTGNEDLVPIKINCWPEEEARGRMNVSIEYSTGPSDVELHDVRIRIPLGTADLPTIVSVDGSHKHNAQQGELIWEIDLIDKSNSSGSLEFFIQQRNADAFFPINVQFSSKQLFCNIDVSSVRSVGQNAPILYGLTRGMSSEDYIIG